MELESKINEGVETYNQLHQKEASLKEELEQVKIAKEQIRGKIIAYQELVQEQQAGNGVVPEPPDLDEAIEGTVVDEDQEK